MSKESESNPAPVVFVSYSHDTDEHKEWVRMFATMLRDYGIDVILDQWEIGAGDDVPKFMEQSVKKALRVVMVCTEPYVRKADDGKGGAGYEVMIVTGELVADLGTNKFVPIMRQSGDPKVLPACVSTRFYVDFSDDASFGEKLQELARNIHEAPKLEKPPLGKNPFLGKTPKPAPVLETTPGEGEDAVSSPLDICRQARAIADAGDFAAWRDLIHRQKSAAATALLAWKEENQRTFPELQKDLPAYFQPAVATHAGLIAAALGAFDSKDERFHSQLALIDDLRNPKGWEKSGPTVWTNLPDLIWFTYQALLGALALSRHRPEAAVGLAQTKITNRYADRDGSAGNSGGLHAGRSFSLPRKKRMRERSD
jgi:hypothetical protein